MWQTLLSKIPSDLSTKQVFKMEVFSWKCYCKSYYKSWTKISFKEFGQNHRPTQCWNNRPLTVCKYRTPRLHAGLQGGSMTGMKQGPVGQKHQALSDSSQTDEKRAKNSPEPSWDITPCKKSQKWDFCHPGLHDMLNTVNEINNLLYGYFVSTVRLHKE